jgi:cell wall-associated NlpC family hydrolase
MPTSLNPALALLLRVTLVAATAFGAVSLAPVATAPAQASGAHRSHRAHMEHHALRVARTKLGHPYQYGAAGPRRFDCSGLTYFAFHRAGFRRLPRTSSQQARFAHHIRRSHMRPGDLVFFTGSGGVYHVGIFTGWRHGHRVIIHSPRPGQRVRHDRIWTNHWFAGTLR